MVNSVPTRAKLLDNLQQTVSQGSLAVTSLPGCDGLKLHLLSANYPRGRLPDNEMMAILEKPAYWAFCWASGHAFATFILQHPHLFAGRRLVDFGSGSGVVAIAAAKAGASKVYACDIDSMAIDAIRVNARLNQVQVSTCQALDQLNETPDLILAADVLYDRENHHYLAEFQRLADNVILADSRLKQMPVAGYQLIHEIESRTMPDLEESAEYNRVRIYRYTTSAGKFSL